MNFIIIGDKYQKGMKSKGCAALIKISKQQTLFEHQYNIIKTHFPDSNIIYISGFESKKLENFIYKNYKDVICIYNKNYDIFNDAYSIFLAKDFLNTNTFILFGYTILDKKIFHKFAIDNGTQIFISNSGNKNIGCIISNSQVHNISYDLPNFIDDIYYLSDNDSLSLQKLVENIKYKNYFVFELINQMIDSGAHIKPFFHKPSNKISLYEYSK